MTQNLLLTNQFGEESSNFVGGSLGGEGTPPSLTFDHSVGAKVVTVSAIGKLVSLMIPAAAIADGLGIACISSPLPAAFRPAVAITFPCVVIDNGTTRKAGQFVIGTNGVVTFSVLGTGFTNAAAAGWDACTATYPIA